jgi:glutamyl-tRNA synthetase
MPEAIRAFCLSLGLSQTEASVPVENLYRENKKFVEKSNRYFFIADPVKITVKSAPKLKAHLALHPDHPERGQRILETDENFYISKDDFKNMARGKNYRLMNLLNFVKDGFLEFVSTEHDDKLEAKMMHWLPQNPKHIIKAEVLMPDGTWVKGFCEKTVEKMKQGDLCQFERFGFCRLDEKAKDKLIFWFSHK